MAIFNGRLAEESFTKDVSKVLQNLKLYTDDGFIKSSAIIAFGKDPKKYFTTCDFRIGRFVGSDSNLIFQDVIEGDAIRMADRVMELLKSKYLTSPIHYEGLVRVEKLEIPEDALREAIFNAIIHKDYTGVHIQMKVHNDRIELWNPGPLPEGYTIKKLVNSHESIPRNSSLANIFYKAGFIENWGRGFSKINEGFVNAGLEPPKFEISGNGFLVTIKRPNAVENGSAQEVIESGQVTREKTREKILNIIGENNSVTTKELADKTGLSIKGVEWQLNKLKEQGLLKRVGPDKGGHWEVIK